MNKIKQAIFRKSFKIVVLKDLSDECVIKFDIPFKLKEEHREYYYLIDEIPDMINGINKIDLNEEDLIVNISYDNKKINLEYILKILDEAKEFIIEEWDYIKENNEDNLDQLINELKIKFRDRISKY